MIEEDIEVLCFFDFFSFYYRLFSVVSENCVCNIFKSVISITQQCWHQRVSARNASAEKSLLDIAFPFFCVFSTQAVWCEDLKMRVGAWEVADCNLL